MPHRLLGATVVAAVLMLAGCSEDPQPKVADSEPSDDSSAVVSTPSANVAMEPEIPGAAMAQTDRGAEAFVRYWINLVNYAQATGDVGSLRVSSERRCVACQGLIEAITEPYESNGRIEGGEWSIGDLRALPLDYGADWAGHAKARSAAQVVVDGDGTRRKYDAGPFDFYAYSAWTTDGWKMRWLRTPY